MHFTEKNKHYILSKVLLGRPCKFDIIPRSHPSLDLGQFLQRLLCLSWVFITKNLKQWYQKEINYVFPCFENMNVKW